MQSKVAAGSRMIIIFLHNFGVHSKKRNLTTDSTP
jgi:hypothetical protein